MPSSRTRSSVSAALDGRFRSTADIASRAGLDAQQVAPVLGRMRRDGTAEWRQQGEISLWRHTPSAGTSLPGS
jgi:hypothetical protein